MPTLTTQYVYFGASGAHTRQPRATASYGGFTPIPGLNPGLTGTLTPGTSFQPGPADPTLTAGTLTLNFAFVNVSGCTEGPLNSFVAATPPPVGTVGTNPISVLYVYVPTDGNGNGSGAVIDAFNESINSLVDNNFVKVSPDPGGTLTSEANTDGWVDTSDRGYTITADNPNIGSYLTWPTTPLFDRWVDLTDPTPPSSLIIGANLTPAKGVTVYALAFYKNPVMKSVKESIPEKPWRVKEWDKEHYKEYPDKTPADVNVYTLKTILEKGGKEVAEGTNFGNLGDPGLIFAELQSLQQRLAKLEADVREQGRAFIKTEDRPPVGRRKKK
jgi:hypothetical protein